MKGRVLHYFAEGNTARGHASLYETNLLNLKKLLIIKGGSKALKSRLLKEVALRYECEGFGMQYIHCPMNHQLIDGFIIEELEIGVVDGIGTQKCEVRIPNKIKQYMSLEPVYTLPDKRDQMEQLTEQIQRLKQEAYLLYRDALRIHDEWEAIYIDNMDFEKANVLTEELIARLFYKPARAGKGKVCRRFLGAATPIGAVDYVPSLTDGLSERFFIKGRPGSGKSTMLKKVAIEAEMKGHDVEIYHCGLDPHSLDMVVVRELGFAVFDSTAPHEYFPEREGDQIIDMYEKCITPGTDEDYAGDIAHIVKRYKGKMEQGTTALAKAKKLQDELEELHEARNESIKAAEAGKKIESFIEDLRSSLNS